MQVNIPHRQFIMRKDCTVGFGDDGYYLRLWEQRDGTTLDLHHEKIILSSQIDPHSRTLCTCSNSYRPMAESEKAVFIDLCPKVVLWQVDWRDSYDVREIEGIGDLRKLLQGFFEYWQGGVGIGCYIDGVPKDALVEVSFGGPSYNKGR